MRPSSNRIIYFCHDIKYINGSRQYVYRKGDAEKELQSKLGFRYDGLTTANGDLYYSLGGGIYNAKKETNLTYMMMRADASIMTHMNVTNWSTDFWDKYEGTLREANDQWGIINNFLDASRTSGNSINAGKVTSAIFTSIDGIRMYNAYKDGTLNGWHIADFSFGIVSYFGIYGAGISQGYKVVRNGPPFLIKMMQAIEDEVYRSMENSMPGSRFPWRRW